MLKKNLFLITVFFIIPSIGAVDEKAPTNKSLSLTQKVLIGSAVGLGTAGAMMATPTIFSAETTIVARNCATKVLSALSSAVKTFTASPTAQTSVLFINVLVLLGLQNKLPK